MKLESLYYSNKSRFCTKHTSSKDNIVGRIYIVCYKHHDDDSRRNFLLKRHIQYCQVHLYAKNSTRVVLIVFIKQIIIGTGLIRLQA